MSERFLLAKRKRPDKIKRKHRSRREGWTAENRGVERYQKQKQQNSLRHLGKCLNGYRGWTTAAAIFGGLEVVLEVFIPMLMSVIVDGGLYREEDFMLRGLFPDALVAQRDRFVLTVGGIMVGIACLSMACGLLSARCSAIASQGFAKKPAHDAAG